MSSHNQALTPQVEQDLFSTSAMAPAFWRARFMSSSSYWHHIPLVFWLCGQLRPRAATIISSYDGVPYFAVCQAMDKLGIPSVCTGVFVQQNMPDVKLKIESESAVFYEALSDLRFKEELPSALECLAAGRSDLMIIDLRVVSNHGQIPLSVFQEKLTPGGLLIFLGTKEYGIPEGSSDYQHIDFNVGSGSRMVLPPKAKSDRPTGLDQLAGSGALPAQAEMMFRRLGQGLADSMEFSVQHLRVAELETDLNAANDTLNVKNSKLAELEKAYEARSRAAWECQAASYDVQQAHQNSINEFRQQSEKAVEANNALRREVEDLKSNMSAKEQELLKASSTRAELEQKLLRTQQTNAQPDLKVQLDARYRELAILTKELERQRAETRQALSGLKNREAEITKLTARIERIKSSLSWRITAPIRAIK